SILSTLENFEQSGGNGMQLQHTQIGTFLNIKQNCSQNLRKQYQESISLKSTLEASFETVKQKLADAKELRTEFSISPRKPLIDIVRKIEKQRQMEDPNYEIKGDKELFDELTLKLKTLSNEMKALGISDSGIDEITKAYDREMLELCPHPLPVAALPNTSVEPAQINLRRRTFLTDEKDWKKAENINSDKTLQQDILHKFISDKESLGKNYQLQVASMKDARIVARQFDRGNTQNNCKEYLKIINPDGTAAHEVHIIWRKGPEGKFVPENEKFKIKVNSFMGEVELDPRSKNYGKITQNNEVVAWDKVNAKAKLDPDTGKPYASVEDLMTDNLKKLGFKDYYEFRAWIEMQGFSS
ncbi:MAG: hypothetical protein K2X81_18690, partial [Candidatus Obscuribacterales bacterium]|nr:hypothetical protein [Candidatus Obscuribacterales bacterium]